MQWRRCAEISFMRNILCGKTFCYVVIDFHFIDYTVAEINNRYEYSELPPEPAFRVVTIQDYQRDKSNARPDGKKWIHYINCVERKSQVAERLKPTDSIVIKSINK